MTTKDTKFVYDDGFILLHDLEAWHSRGYLNPGDSIIVIDKGCGAKIFVIKELIKLHGSQFPFRRGNTPAVTGILDECVYTSLKLLEEWKNGPKIEIELSEDVRRELARAVLVDWPLFNVDNEPDGERITGERVVEEMLKLKKKMKWAKSKGVTFASFFSFLDRKDHDKTQTICRLCHYSPPSAELFFHHLFKYFHIKSLSNQRVSKRSFDFWYRKFDQCSLVDQQEQSIEIEEGYTEEQLPELMEVLTREEEVEDQEDDEKKISSGGRRRETEEEDDQAQESLTTDKEDAEEHDEGQSHTRDQLLSLRHLQNECPELFEKGKLMKDEESSAFDKDKRPDYLKNEYPVIKESVKTRVPLLDQMPPGEESVTKERFQSFFDECVEIFKKNRITILNNKPDKLKNQPLCTFCINTVYISEFTDENLILMHILSPTHRENMKQKASESDLQYWYQYLLTMKEPRKKEENERETKKKVVNKLDDRNIQFTVESRIPLLDPPLPENSLPTFKLLPEDIGYTSAKFRSVIKKCTEEQLRMMKEERIDRNCTQCEDTVILSTKFDAATHSFSREHLKRIHKKVLHSDLDYWARWLLEFNPALVDEFSPNARRVPLLDQLAPGEESVSEERFQSVLDECQRIFRRKQKTIIKNETERYENGNRPLCTFCYNFKISDKYQLLLHILSPTHRRNMKRKASESDLQYWYQYLLTMKEPLPNEKQEKKQGTSKKSKDTRTQKELSESIPTDPIQKPLEISKSACLLPLFASNHSWRKLTDTVCVGPTREQITLVEKLTEIGPTIFIQNQTLCGTCHVDMSNWSIHTVAKHVFSVEHLNQFIILGGRFMVEDFEWWMTTLKIKYENEKYEPSPLQIQHLGGWRPISNPGHGSDFRGFTACQKKEFENLDDSKVVSKTSELLEKFAACVYCNKWILTGSDVLRHYTSEQHFEMVKKRHPVSQAEVEKMLHYVRLCQKGAKCVVM